MRKKAFFYIFFILSFVVLFYLIKRNYGKEKSPNRCLSVGVVFSFPGIGDRSYNDSAYMGIQRAKEQFDINVEYIEPKSFFDVELEFLEFAGGDYELIIAVGYGLKDICEKAAEKFPNKHFVILDEEINLPNVTSIMFRSQEGAFLAGFLAGKVTKTNTLGFVGGNHSEVVEKFRRGYKEGAFYGNERVEIREKFIGGENPFGDPSKGEAEALSLINEGADIILHAAGESGLGVIEAAKNRDILAIGVDMDQEDEAPGTILVSVVKSLDGVIFDIIYDQLKGEGGRGKNRSLGLKEGGIKLSDPKESIEIPNEIYVELEEIKKKIVEGRLRIE